VGEHAKRKKTGEEKNKSGCSKTPCCETRAGGAGGHFRKAQERKNGAPDVSGKVFGRELHNTPRRKREEKGKTKDLKPRERIPKGHALLMVATRTMDRNALNCGHGKKGSVGRVQKNSSRGEEKNARKRGGAKQCLKRYRGKSLRKGG